jgi:hypothetical protein
MCWYFRLEWVSGYDGGESDMMWHLYKIYKIDKDMGM